jgi:protoheme ferro-lyase
LKYQDRNVLNLSLRLLGDHIETLHELDIEYSQHLATDVSLINLIDLFHSLPTFRLVLK